MNEQSQNDSCNIQTIFKSSHLQDDSISKDPFKNIKIYIPDGSYDSKMTFEQNLAAGRVKLFNEMPANDGDTLLDPVVTSNSELREEHFPQTPIQLQRNIKNFSPQNTSDFDKLVNSPSQSISFTKQEKCSILSKIGDALQLNVSPDTHKQHLCDVCFQSFNRRRDLALHYLIHTEKEKRRAAKSTKLCDICKKVSTLCNCTRIVEQIYPNSSNTSSNYCISQTPSKIIFKTESSSGDSSIVQRELFPCPDCKQTFGLLAQLKQHALVHKRERAKREKEQINCNTMTEDSSLMQTKSFSCPDCAETFSFLSQLDLHALIHKRDKVEVEQEQNNCNSTEKSSVMQKEMIPCPECDCTLGSRIELKQHLILHKREQRKLEEEQNKSNCRTGNSNVMVREEFPCPDCNKPLSSRLELKAHELLHKREKVKSEEEQSKSNSTTGNSNVIMREMFPCPECDQAFGLLAQLKLHALAHKRKQAKIGQVQNNHIKTSGDVIQRKVFFCRDCNQTFSSLAQLKQHALVHKEKAKKDQNYSSTSAPISSSKVFIKTESTMGSSSVQRPSFSCPNCTQTFGLLSQLKQHALVHKKEQAKKKQKQKSFNCNICSEKFTDKSSLVYHVSTVHQESSLLV